MEILEILTDDGNINEIGGELFAGMKRYNARIAIRKDLKAAVCFFFFFFGGGWVVLLKYFFFKNSFIFFYKLIF